MHRSTPIRSTLISAVVAIFTKGQLLILQSKDQKSCVYWRRGTGIQLLGTYLVVTGLCRDWTLLVTVVVSGGQQTVVPHWLMVVISSPGLCLHTVWPDVCDTSLSVITDTTHKRAFSYCA